MIAVATWNLLFKSDPERTLAYLEGVRWDVACLQEVSPAAAELFRARPGWSVIHGVDLAPEAYRSWKQPHAAAIVARNGWAIRDAELAPGTPRPGRCVRATAARAGESVSVISWHAPNKVGDGLEAKMAGYQAAIDAINATDGALVVGLDSNHWSLGTDLEAPEHDPAHPHAVENQFFSRTPQHRLRDALVAYLREHPDVHEELVALRPRGPLEVTYVRGWTPDRFDYLMVSDEFTVADITHDFVGATAAGSDHGFVSAVLEKSHATGRSIGSRNGARPMAHAG